MNSETVALAAGTLVLGAGLGYYLGTKRTIKAADEIIKAEVSEARDFYARTFKADEYNTPESAAEALGANVNLEKAADALRIYKGMSATDVIVDELAQEEEPERPKSKNIFSDSTDVLAIDDRRPDQPYVISLEEWMENEPENNQISVTWYAGDHILADEREDIIEDVDQIVGHANLELFGLASGDPNVVHVRLEMRDLDIEVNRHSGEFRRIVQGFTDDDLQHSDQRMRRRPRWDE